MKLQLAPGLKLGTHVAADASDDYLRYLKQLGIDHVRVHVPAEADSEAEVRALQARFAAAGLDIFTIVYSLYKAKEIALGLPGRDEKLDRFADFLGTMGRCGLHTLEYDFFLYAPLPSTGYAETRGAASRAFDLAHAEADDLVFGRVYEEEEMWANYAYMMERLLPAAEEANVRLALHPDDPPVPMLNGTARIFRHIDGFKRAMELADSPAWGVLFCVGTWAEGGDAMGMSVTQAIRFLAERDKLFTVHFRNVSAPLPAFTETFIDNGYVDMQAVIATLQEVGFNGLMIPDHFPHFTSDQDQRAALAYAIGYMRALVHATAD